MLKVTKYGLSLIIPQHWIDGRGFLKVPAVCALKLFYNEISLEDALIGAEKKRKYGWTIKEVNSNEQGS